MNYKAQATYRPDIDGLRAIAVVSVVLFHAMSDMVPSGFTGVDVFFVISGFLITGIVWRELIEKRFSFGHFYARRVRRIFPVLVMVLLSSLALGWYVLFADEYKQLGNHVMRSSLFLSNFALWRESGYFDAQAELKPSLHLWSLAIEEQFYLIWPGFLWLLYRWTRQPLRWVLIFIGLSMGWNLYQSHHDSTHDFYSPLTRFWELMSGAALAIAWLQVCQQVNAKTKRLMGILALGFLIASVFFVQGGAVYPGAWALLPVCGALFVIASDGQQPVLQRILTNPISLWIGEISYALYLWHWPILSYARIIEGATPSLVVRALGVFVAFILAGLSVRYVERPLRQGPLVRTHMVIVCVAMGLTCLFGYLINRFDGFEHRSIMGDAHIAHAGSIGHDEYHRVVVNRFFPCANQKVLTDAGDWLGIKRCFQSKSSDHPDLLLLGDSHAEHLFPGLAEQLSGLNVVFHGKGSLPFHDNPDYAVIFDEILKSPAHYPILISAQWHTRINQIPKGESLAKKLSETIERLEESGKTVYLIDDVFQFPYDPQRCKYQRPFSARVTCDAPNSMFEDQRKKYISDLRAVIIQHPRAHLLEVGASLCDEAACSMLIQDEMAYRDNNHLSIAGSNAVAQAILKHMPKLVDSGP